MTVSRSLDKCLPMRIKLESTSSSMRMISNRHYGEPSGNSMLRNSISVNLYSFQLGTCINHLYVKDRLGIRYGSWEREAGRMGLQSVRGLARVEKKKKKKKEVEEARVRVREKDGLNRKRKM